MEDIAYTSVIAAYHNVLDMSRAHLNCNLTDCWTFVVILIPPAWWYGLGDTALPNGTCSSTWTLRGNSTG
ncbi:hypothetical protein TNCV_1739581 [Trichonephila clavipes]|nr:hypothetical protein TNCV_1739581 [Trichonephila clavipes]